MLWANIAAPCRNIFKNYTEKQVFQALGHNKIIYIRLITFTFWKKKWFPFKHERGNVIG